MRSRWPTMTAAPASFWALMSSATASSMRRNLSLAGAAAGFAFAELEDADDCDCCRVSTMALAAGDPAAARVREMRARMHREMVRGIGGILWDILHHLMHHHHPRPLDT